MKTLEEAFECIEKKAGDVIIKQGIKMSSCLHGSASLPQFMSLCVGWRAGDIGDNFYVLDSGKVEVFKKVGDAQEQKVGTWDRRVN